MTDGWIKHKGGPRPVPADTMVQAIFADGLQRLTPWAAGRYDCHHPNFSNQSLWEFSSEAVGVHITHYRIALSAGDEL